MLRARLGWTRRSHGDVSSRGHAIYDGMKKKTFFAFRNHLWTSMI